MESSPLHIAAFIDTRPGHVKQTRGVLSALSGLTQIAVTEVHVPHPGLFKQAGEWATWILSGGVTPRECRPLDRAPDLIIGTGTHTHLPMLHFRRECAARVVTCMTPSSLLRKHFDLCVVPLHDKTPPADNIFFTTGPPNTAGIPGRHESSSGLILVGGEDKKSHTWDSLDILEKVRAIMVAESDIFWTVSSSFRTPESMMAMLEQLSATMNNCEFFAAKDTRPGWIEDQYAASDTCWVTADSVSMVYEALTAGCRVGVFPVAWKKPDGKLARGVDGLVERNRVLLFEDWAQKNKDWGARRKLDEAERAAQEILRRWWPDRLL